MPLPPFPGPWPPQHPRPPVPLVDEGAEADGGWPGRLRDRLLDRRTVFVTRALDDAVAGRAAVELMALDGWGDEPVHLHLDSAGGSLDAALTLMDVIELLGVPVTVTCVGRAEGPAVGVVAVAARRRANPHSRFLLREPEAAFTGRARELTSWAERHQRQLEDFCRRVAEATRWTPERLAAEMRSGRYLDAEEALRHGLVDEIAKPAADVHRLPGRGVGFRPR